MREQIREKLKEDRKGSALIYDNTTTTTTNKRPLTFNIEWSVVFKIIKIHKMTRLFKCFIFYPRFIKYHSSNKKLELVFLSSPKIAFKSN